MNRSVTTLVVFGLLAVACNGTTDSTTSTTESFESTTTAGSESTSSSAAATTSTSSPEAAGGGSDCLEGDWVLDNDAFIEGVFAEFGGGDFGEASAAGGLLTVSFDSDGTMTTARDEWGFVVARDEGTFQILISGDQSGSWEADGEVLTISLDKGPPPEITTSLIVDGQEVPMPQSPIEVPAEALSATSSFTCDGDTLTVTTDEFTSMFQRP